MAGHDMSTMDMGAPTQPDADPHAGHDMSTMNMGTPAPAQPAADPHAGHDMSGMTAGQTPATPATPAAGPDMSTMNMGTPAPAQPAADPHAGHDMSGMTAGQTSATPATSAAGHDMSTMNMGQMPTQSSSDPHAGHDMAGMGAMAMPPDVPTSANNPGRPPQDPIPVAALGWPAHAADLLFDPSEMMASRAQLLVENGDIRTTAVIIDQLEAGSSDGEESYSWDAQGWTGGDINRFWWKSEGEGEFGGGLEEAELQALYSRAIRPFFDVQAGVRQTYRPEGADRTDLVVGIQGLAPYWFEVDAAAFLSTKGELTARAEAEYDQRITNRWILQPSVEVAFSASDVPELAMGTGLTSVQLGARLRYEIRREFAPYVGIEWSKSFGGTADYLEASGRGSEDTRIVVGLRAWF
ncbi:copper resistance protein B [Brevundimonas vesicularis]|uniref:copper resistance protein B n=1 Tax=Brevundimonas vesicularis TaxID=41276 RepID=UPI001FD09F79|nr:copper resistance protein B [Brevundimonas vesicularis]